MEHKTSKGLIAWASGEKKINCINKDFVVLIEGFASGVSHATAVRFNKHGWNWAR